MSEWTSPQLQRFAAEAVWDRATYDKLVADWHHDPSGSTRSPSGP